MDSTIDGENSIPCELPRDLLLEVVSLVRAPKDITSLLCTSRHLAALAKDPQLAALWLWRHRQRDALSLAAGAGLVHVLQLLLDRVAACMAAASAAAQSHAAARQQPMLQAWNGGNSHVVANHSETEHQQEADANRTAASSTNHPSTSMQGLHGSMQASLPAPSSLAADRMRYAMDRALVAAARANCPAVISLLIGRGAHVDGAHLVGGSSSLTTAGGRPLAAAAAKGCLDAMQELLRLGADVRAGGGQALHLAAMYGQEAAVQLLLAAGAAAPSAAGGAAAAAGAAADDDGAADHGERDVQASMVDALCAAAEGGHLGVVRMLLEAGCPAVGAAARLSAEAGHLSVLRLLWSAGARAHEGAAGEALVLAAAGGHGEVVGQLLDWGVDVHVAEDGALRAAAEGGHLEVVHALLDRGADVHAQDGGALRRAAERGHADVVSALLARGAVVSVGGEAALKAAARLGHLEMVVTLLDAGADLRVSDDYPLRTAASIGAVEVVEELLRRGADAHANDDEALLWAADNRHEGVVRLLLRHGARVSGPNGEHVLWCAISRGSSGIVRALMDAGASLLASEGDGGCAACC